MSKLEFDLSELKVLLDLTLNKCDPQLDVNGKIQKNIKEKLRSALLTNEKISISFYSNTYKNGNISFVIYVDNLGLSEGESEKFVVPLLDPKWHRIGEDTYELNVSYSPKAFEDEKKELVSRNFLYQGPIDEDCV